MTSIDVVRKGIDKAYGIKKISERLGVGKKDMLFLGDKLEEGGNDYPVKATGVMCIQVKASKRPRGYSGSYCNRRNLHIRAERPSMPPTTTNAEASQKRHMPTRPVSEQPLITFLSDTSLPKTGKG